MSAVLHDACPAAPVAAADALRPEPLSRGRVLHVDDDPVSSLVLCEWLRHNHYEVTAAAGPAEAEPLLAAGNFDLIISDVHMPGNHRLEWIEHLLFSGPGQPAPIMLMTGSPALETALRAANLPVAGYLIKPPVWATLDARLQQILAAERRRREFQALSRDIFAIIASPSGSADLAQETQLLHRLATLAGAFSAGSGRAGQHQSVTRDSDDQRWRFALQDTIQVIEKTKHSFRSKELGQLRQRLESLLGGSLAA